MTEFTKVKKETDHPLEDVFEIEPYTTPMEVTTAVPQEVVTPENYDDKDTEIEQQLQEIYEAAMGQFEVTREEIEKVEGKYKARNGEVALQALQTALSAVQSKASVKANKDKLAIKQQTAGPSTLNQNLIVADRNELLKALGNETK